MASDGPTAELLLGFYLEDLDAIIAGNSTNLPPDTVDDVNLPLVLHRAELQRGRFLLEDHRIATSLSNACGTDHNAIADPVAIAIQAACDSVLGQHLAAGVLTPVEILGQHDQVDGQVSNNDPGAPVGFECNGVAQSLQELSLSGGDVTTHGSREHSESDNGSEVDMGNEVESVSEYDTVYNDSEVGVGSEVADFSDCANATDAEEIIKQKTYVCVICEDVQSTEADILTAPCAHNYCRACTVEVFQNAIRDEELFPPRCCTQPLPVDQAKHFLTTKLAKAFDEKAIEFTTPNRIYCSDSKCAAFIPPRKITGDVAVCRKCSHKTCVTCKESAHTGECPKNPQIVLLLETAKKEGWKECYNCNRMISITTGCNHMTCVHFLHLCIPTYRMLMSFADVCAKRNYVISVENPGSQRTARAPYGKSVFSTTKPPESPHERSHAVDKPMLRTLSALQQPS